VVASESSSEDAPIPVTVTQPLVESPSPSSSESSPPETSSDDQDAHHAVTGTTIPLNNSENDSDDDPQKEAAENSDSSSTSSTEGHMPDPPAALIEKFRIAHAPRPAARLARDGLDFSSDALSDHDDSPPTSDAKLQDDAFIRGGGLIQGSDRQDDALDFSSDGSADGHASRPVALTIPLHGASDPVHDRASSISSRRNASESVGVAALASASSDDQFPANGVENEVQMWSYEYRPMRTGFSASGGETARTAGVNRDGSEDDSSLEEHGDAKAVGDC
jgi:hypothetical protein